MQSERRRPVGGQELGVDNGRLRGCAQVAMGFGEQALKKSERIVDGVANVCNLMRDGRHAVQPRPECRPGCDVNEGFV